MIEYTERKGTGCIKWDALEETFGSDGLLPLWVADMDFRVDRHITDAVEGYLKPEELQPFMQDRCRLAFDYGSWFGGDRSGSFIRINLATSRENIVDMAVRMIRELD